MTLRLSNYTKFPLEAIDRALVQWKNLLAPKKNVITFTLAEGDQTYTVRMPSQQFITSQFKYGVLIEIDGVPASVWLTSWPLATRLDSYLSGKNLTDLPVDLRAELLEAAYKPLLSSIIFHTNTPIRIINFLNLKPSEVSEFSLELILRDNLNRQESRIMIVMHDKLVPVMKKLLAYWPNEENHFWINNSTALWVQAGSVEISLQDLNQLEVFDILMMDSCGEVDRVCLRLGSGEFFQAVIQSNQLILESGVLRMSDETNDENIASIDEVPVRLTFDLGDLIIPFSEVKSLTQGSIVNLNTPVTQAVTIRSLNRVIGTGELVNIDGQMGVKIIKLFQQKKGESSDG